MTLKTLLTIYTLLLAILLATNKRVYGKKCGCTPNLCCIKYGYCGTSNDNRGNGSQSGPCNDPRGNNGVRVSDIVTDSLFNVISHQVRPHCRGTSFYSRASFLDAIGSYPNFGTTCSTNDSKREIAAFFAHVMDETERMCFVEEPNGLSKNYCDKTKSQYPCAPNKGYYGRGPLQLSWNYNYGAAGQSIGFDGLNNPEIVATNPIISFKTALWFWMNKCHDIIISGQGFGATIRAINDLKCNQTRIISMSTLIHYYRDLCEKIGVGSGSNLGC